MRWLFLVALGGCVSAAPVSDAERVRLIMGVNDDHKVKIQYRTHAPDEEINRRLADVERGIRTLLELRPFADDRDEILHTMTARTLPAIAEIRAARWTKENVDSNWKKLEAVCAGCHKALERR